MLRTDWEYDVTETSLYLKHIKSNLSYTFNKQELKGLSEERLSEIYSNKLTDYCIITGFKIINKNI